MNTPQLAEKAFTGRAFLILWAYFLLLMAPPVQAKLVTVKALPSSFPEKMPFGEIVREIRIEGNKHTNEEVLHLALKTQIGNPYIEENAALDLLWISRLGSFTAVTFTTEPMAEGIALIVTVTEGSPYIPGLSIALTQENGLEIGPSFSSSNLLGTAARASAYARFGGATNLGIKYAAPLLRGWSLLNGVQGQYYHRERTNQLFDFGETTNEVFFEYKHANSDFVRSGMRFRYLDLSSDQDGITLDPDNTDHIPAFGLFIQQDSRNSVYPTKGFYFDAEVSRYGIFGGQGNYWRLNLDARQYVKVPILGQRSSLAFTTLASLQNGEVGRTIPLYEEFQIGGTNSVRGWSLGSRQGQNQWLTTIEYWYRLMDQKVWNFWFIHWRMGMQLGVFGDIGTAWSEPDALQENWIGGYGAGFRLTLPVVTMVRFDLAYGESGANIRIFIGGGEKADTQKQRVR